MSGAVCVRSYPGLSVSSDKRFKDFRNWMEGRMGLWDLSIGCLASVKIDAMVLEVTNGVEN